MLFVHRTVVACMSGLLALAWRDDAAAAAPLQSAASKVAARANTLGVSPRPAIELRTRSHSAASAAYTIDDVGMPSGATYPSSSPIGFNNSGQIFGTALRSAKGDRLSYAVETDCIVWTGTHFVDIEPSLTIRTCTPYAIDTADRATGTYVVVGAVSDIHHVDHFNYYNTLSDLNDAFYATVAASGSFAVRSYYDHSPAGLYGVNSTGTAAGYSYNYANNNAIFITTPPAQISILQPSCATTATACLATVDSLYTQTNGEPLRTCAFGGCTINDSGTVLGVDPATSLYTLYTIGVPGSTVELPLPIAKGSFGYVVALNDANQLVYFSIATPTASYIYNANSGTTTTIPPVAGTSCGHYYPVSMNDLGTVLGFTSFCKGRSFYYIWDAIHGTQNLNLELPANAYTIRPLGINDNGQILVSLVTSTGATHWGTLDPVTTAKTPRARSKELQHAR